MPLINNIITKRLPTVSGDERPPWRVPIEFLPCYELVTTPILAILFPPTTDVENDPEQNQIVGNPGGLDRTHRRVQHPREYELEFQTANTELTYVLDLKYEPVDRTRTTYLESAIENEKIDP